MTEILLWVVAFLCFALPLAVVALGFQLFGDDEPQPAAHPAAPAEDLTLGELFRPQGTPAACTGGSAH